MIPPPSPDRPVTHEQVAARAGAFAARRGHPVTACPYDRTAPGTGHFAHTWVASYLAHKPPKPGQVDYSPDDEADASDIRNTPPPMVVQTPPPLNP